MVNNVMSKTAYVYGGNRELESILSGRSHGTYNIQTLT